MFATLACLLAVAQGAAPKTETIFFADVTTVQPGRPFTVALRIKMAPNWHTYYLNPGDAGQATEIHWKLPPGFTAGPIQWPVPEREDFQGISSYVYEDEVWLLTQITPPKALKQDAPVRLAAHCTWLLCSTGCVPQSSDLVLDLRSGRSAVLNAPLVGSFTAARKAIPVATSGMKVMAVARGKSVRLGVDGIASTDGIRFIPADVDAFGANEPKASIQNGKLVLDLSLTDYAKKFPARLKGILVTRTGAYAIDSGVIQVSS